MTNRPPHIVLGLEPDASDSEIKKKFRRLAKDWHPDRYKGSKEYGTEQFNRIKDAHDKMLSKEYQDTRKNIYNRPTNTQPNPFTPVQPFNYPQSNSYFPMPAPSPRFQSVPSQRPGGVSVLCNGTVLLSGGFRPSQMTPELLRHLQNTSRPH